jgi:deoxyribodipyrimidine photo-lyase
MPLVDAFMRSLNTTGYMPDRGRMIVASYLCLDLQMDWRLGASYFEEMSIDYDYGCNYGGWCLVSGLTQAKPHALNIIL